MKITYIYATNELNIKHKDSFNANIDARTKERKEYLARRHCLINHPMSKFNGLVKEQI